MYNGAQQVFARLAIPSDIRRLHKLADGGIGLGSVHPVHRTVIDPAPLELALNLGDEIGARARAGGGVDLGPSQVGNSRSRR